MATILSSIELIIQSRTICNLKRLYTVNLFHTAYGRNVPTVVEQPLQQGSLHEGRNTVAYEARLLKALFLRLT